MIRLEHPEALLLGVILVAVLRRRLLRGRAVTAIRVVLLIVLTALLADPWLEGRASGRDLVLVVDRSLSAPDGTMDAAAEATALAAARVRPGDRIGLVAFGRDAVVERAPREGWRWEPPARSIDPDGTDLAEALDRALALIPPDRQGSILLVSDGEGTGRDPAAVARHALRRGVRIDALWQRRSGAFDLAVEEVAVPDVTAAGEPVQVSVWIRSDRAQEAPIRVLRDGVEIATGVRRFRRGLNRVRFRDVVREPGVHVYDVAVTTVDDRVVENDRARAAMRVTGPFRVLCVTPVGREDRLTRSLRLAGLDVVVAPPPAAPIHDRALDGFRAVILEDVPLQDLRPGAAAALGRYVRDLGGGLLMTGGRASYGPGGYHRSVVEDVLPVTMEIREEQRKYHLAMAIALDRSGSMAMPVGGGRTKMDLANLGACAAVELLGPADSVAVLAIDSAAHLVVPLTSAGNAPAVCADIRRIESMGGGIFTATALHAAASQLTGARQGTRHIVLFADAADAEEPGDYRTFVPGLSRAGVTVSVIGLGTEKDSDAAFLKEVAALGKGRCFFVADPSELPRVFAQETIEVARSSFADEPAAVAVLPDLLAVGALDRPAFPSVGGYSIAYGKPGAQRGLVTKDDTAAPLLSFWQCGLGRSAAYLGVADGEHAGDVAGWDGYADFFATLVRWVAGTEAADDVFAEVERRGHEAILSVEVDAADEALLSGLEARVLDPDGTARDVLLTRAGDTRLEARIPLVGEGLYRPVLRLADGRFLRLPATTLPYSPEYEPRMDPSEGEKTLRRIVRIAEGRLEPPADALLAGSRASRGTRSLAPWLAWAAVGLLLTEIAVRRLRPRLAVPEGVRKAVTAVASRIPSPRLPRLRRRREPPATEKPEPEAEAPPPPPTDITTILDRAKKRRRR